MQEAARKILFAVATARARGERLLKLRYTDGQETRLRHYFRTWREEHLISVFAGKRELGDGGVTAEYLSAMYPALSSDADFTACDKGVFFLAL